MRNTRAGCGADVGQRRHHQLLRLQHLADPLGIGVLVAQLVANDREIVVQGFMYGSSLAATSPGK